MNCIIIEDEIPAQRIIKNYCSKINDLNVLEVFNSALKANSFIKKTPVDLIFLDINLPDLSGMEFIKSLHRPPMIIITSAYPDYAVESFEFDVIVDYLVKPFSIERFLKAINKAIRVKQNSVKPHITDPVTSFFLTVDKVRHNIYFSDVKYVVSDRNYCTFIMKESKLTCIHSLRNFEEELPFPNFIRVHKSYIINCLFIDKISGNYIQIGDDKIPIGRTYKTSFYKRLKLL